MTVTTRHGCIIVTFSGAMRTFNEALLSRLAHEVRELRTPGPTILLVDVAKVTDVDATGIGLLMACYALAALGDGQIALCGANSLVMSVLTSTRLAPMFRHYRTIEHAIESWTTGWSAPAGGATPCGSDVAHGRTTSGDTKA